MAITNETSNAGLKTVFDGTGTGQEFFKSDLVSAADFTTGTGVGTVDLEIQLAGDFLPFASVTADQVAIPFGNANKAFVFRWNCTAFTSGLITTYLQ